MVRQITDLENEFFGMPNAGDLRTRYVRAGGWIDAVKKLAASIDEMERGEFLTLGELMDVIRT